MHIPYLANKRLGQNFLIDKNIINKIVDIGNINDKKVIFEIGAGYGSLTKKIFSKNPKKIIAVEKDKKLASYLKELFINYKNVKIVNEDILNIIENKKLEKNIVIFGNLPYNISTKILVKLALIKKWPPWYDNLIFMFQKEVADKIQKISEGCQYYAIGDLKLKNTLIFQKIVFFLNQKLILRSCLLVQKEKMNLKLRILKI